MKKEKKELGLIAIIGAIICAMICILNVDSKLAIVVSSMGIGMNIVLLIETVEKKKVLKKKKEDN